MCDGGAYFSIGSLVFTPKKKLEKPGSTNVVEITDFFFQKRTQNRPPHKTFLSHCYFSSFSYWTFSLNPSFCVSSSSSCWKLPADRSPGTCPSGWLVFDRLSRFNIGGTHFPWKAQHRESEREWASERGEKSFRSKDFPLVEMCAIQRFFAELWESRWVVERIRV